MRDSGKSTIPKALFQIEMGSITKNERLIFAYLIAKVGGKCTSVGDFLSMDKHERLGLTGFSRKAEKELEHITCVVAKVLPTLAKIEKSHVFPVADFIYVIETLCDTREKEVLKLLYDQNLSLRLAGKKFLVSGEFVRQIRIKAFSKLHPILTESISRARREFYYKLKATYGIVDIDELATDYSCTPYEIKLTLSIISQNNDTDKDKVEIMQNYAVLSSVKGTINKQFSGLIRAALHDCKWPLRVTELYKKVKRIPRGYIDRFLHVNLKVKVRKNIVQKIHLPGSEMCRIILRQAEVPLHTNEIYLRGCKYFGADISQNAYNDRLIHLPDFVMTGKSMFMLYSNLPFSSSEIKKLRDAAYSCLLDEKNYLWFRVLYEKVVSRLTQNPRKAFNPYVLYSFVKFDERFSVKYRMMVGLPSFEASKT